jgi:DNA replication protein DnaC
MNPSTSTSVCERCGGTGWMIVEKGGLSGATRCECQFQKRTQLLMDRAGIPANYAKASFENFLLPSDNPISKNALANVLVTVRSYAREFPALPKPGLLFVGDPGVGKTHLAVAALRILISRGFEGVFYDYQSLLEQIRAGYSESMQTASRDAYQRALDAEILLLDDLGAHRVSDWVEDTVTAIITHRCNQNKATLVTTNLPDSEAGSPVAERSAGRTEYRTTLAERIGARARSRLFEMCRVVKMPAVEDYRIKSKQAR